MAYLRWGIGTGNIYCFWETTRSQLKRDQKLAIWPSNLSEGEEKNYTFTYKQLKKVNRGWVYKTYKNTSLNDTEKYAIYGIIKHFIEDADEEFKTRRIK